MTTGFLAYEVPYVGDFFPAEVPAKMRIARNVAPGATLVPVFREHIIEVSPYPGEASIAPVHIFF
jgi:hypothetical protein